MSATILPFPAWRRVHAVRRLAERIARAEPTKGNAILFDALRRLRMNLERRGVARPLVAAQIMAMEVSVRREMNAASACEGGAA